MIFLTPIFILLAGIVLGYLVRQFLALRKIDTVERKIKEKIEKNREEVSKILISAKEKAASLIEEAQKEEKERKNQLSRLEERLLKKEEILEKESFVLENKKKEIEEKKDRVEEDRIKASAAREQLSKELEKISGLNIEQAKSQLLKEAEKIHQEEIFVLLQKLEKEKREIVEKKSLEIISSSLQRYARAQIIELTTSIVNLPNEEMKGKIIGREGRNIRALEKLTGVDIIVDETPEAITLSCFDPLRREVAKLSLEKLIRDGRIQPAKIEEKVAEAKEELSQRIKEIGEKAVYETGILDLPKEIVFLLGKLNFRTSYGQNALWHSMETALIAGLISSELGINVEVAKKAGLLHDIGKAISQETEISHLEAGRKILKKYGIEEKVIKAMESHHEDYPFSSPESFVVAAADTISTARPGARRDTLENYLHRLEELEKLALSFKGVKSAYVISGGKELRVFVIPEKIDDFGALGLARDIAAKIQTELSYPGEIKVDVIREIRAVEYAK